MSIKYRMNVPAYAYEMLWITNGETWQQSLKKSGTLDLPATSAEFQLRWGRADGSPLQRWASLPPLLTWEGQVRVWGHVNTAHIMVLDELDMMILEVMGNAQTLPHSRLPSLEQLRLAPHHQDNFVDASAQVFWYAFMLPVDSSLTDFAYQSLVNGNAVECYGALADQQVGLHRMVGMPFVLESITLYGSP